jgi:hypothetical protein
MLFNILYYDQVKNAEQTTTSAGLSLGTIRVNLEQVRLLPMDIHRCPNDDTHPYAYISSNRSSLVSSLKYFRYFRIYY